MKIKVLKKAYYDNELLQENQIIDFVGDKIPSWATLADGYNPYKKMQNTNPKKLSKKYKTEND